MLKRVCFASCLLCLFVCLLGTPVVVSQSIASSMDNIVSGSNTPIPIHTDEEVLQYHPLPRYDSDDEEPRFESSSSMYSPYSTTPNKVLASNSALSKKIALPVSLNINK
jgi:hypothetical protein